MTEITGDTMWAENSENVAFNSLPAAFTPDYRALRYLTAPNMVVSDAENHAPGVANTGPFLLMNPFSSRCCQHNHTSGWPNYAETAWMATSDGGLAAVLYAPGEVTAKTVGGETTLVTDTQYPFDDTITITVKSAPPGAFPAAAARAELGTRREREGQRQAPRHRHQARRIHSSRQHVAGRRRRHAYAADDGARQGVGQKQEQRERRARPADLLAQNRRELQAGRQRKDRHRRQRLATHGRPGAVAPRTKSCPSRRGTTRWRSTRRPTIWRNNSRW